MMNKKCVWGFFVYIFLMISARAWSVGPNAARTLSSDDYAPDRILVRFAPKQIEKQVQRNGRTETRLEARQLNRNEKKQILDNVSLTTATVEKEYRRVQGLTKIKLNQGETVESALAKLKNQPDILYAEPDYKIYLAATFPSDPHINNNQADPNNVLWGLHNVGQMIQGVTGNDC